MAVNTYTPLLHEVLKKVHNAKTKEKKIQILQQNNSDALRMIIKGSFDPNIEWEIPYGDVPYTPNDAPEGPEHPLLFQESKQLYHALKIRKIPTILVEIPGASHNISKKPSNLISKISHIIAWLDSY